MEKYKKIFIFTTAGGKYLDWYKKYTLPSLEDDFKRLTKEGYELSLVQNGFGIDEKKLPNTIEQLQKARSNDPISAVILPGLRACVQKCIDEDAIFFLAPPDTIFAKDTLYNMVKLSENKEDCIALPHIRISVDKYDIQKPTAKQLVKMAFDYKHDAFMNCFDSKDENGTWAGISIRQINKNIYSMIHNLPTVYLAKFKPKDLYFWENAPIWGLWDRDWLRSLFIENRVKVIGSSNMGFCVEMTEKNKNAPESRPNLKYNDKYFSNDIHNNICNKFIFTLEK